MLLVDAAKIQEAAVAENAFSAFFVAAEKKRQLLLLHPMTGQHCR